MPVNRKVILRLIITLIKASLAQQITFTNVAPIAGINHSYLIDFFAGGLGFCDANNDGYDDLTFSSQNDAEISTYKNQGSSFKNIFYRFGIENHLESKTILWADYDNDGDKDLYIANYTENIPEGGKNRLFRNDRGAFTDVTGEAGFLLENSHTTGACWGDYNNDGWIDLYEVNRSFSESNRLYKNNGDGTFTDVTIFAGVSDTYHKPLAVSFLDYDNDGWQDIYIDMDFRQGNVMFKNNGDGTFTDVSEISGTQLFFAAMGTAIGDFNNDGWIDIYVTNGPNGNGLLKNNGDNTFSEVAGILGLRVNKLCWGASFFDYDNDTDLDLFVCVSEGLNGQGDPERQNVLYNNNGDGTFTQAIGSGLDVDTSYSYGSAIGDYNNDGWIDLAILNANGTKSELWKNNGGTNNWIKILLQGTLSNRDGIGSKMEFYVQGKKFIRTTHCGISYQSQDSFTNTIGIGTAKEVDSIIIKWSSGTIDILKNIRANQFLKINEGTHPQQFVKKKIGIPNEYELKQNYPNPFNPSTRIEYSLAKDGWVVLDLYDILGEKIAQLVNENKESGNYSVQFDASQLPSGIYLYKIKTDNFVQVKKMFLLK